MITIVREEVRLENSLTCIACKFVFKWRVPTPSADKKTDSFMDGLKEAMKDKKTADLFENMFGKGFKP